MIFDKKAKSDPTLCYSCKNSIVVREGEQMKISRTQPCDTCFHNPVSTKYDKYKSKENT